MLIFGVWLAGSLIHLMNGFTSMNIDVLPLISKTFCVSQLHSLFMQKLPGYNEILNFQQVAYGALMLNFFNINAHPFFIKKYTGSLYKIYWTDTLVL